MASNAGPNPQRGEPASATHPDTSYAQAAAAPAPSEQGSEAKPKKRKHRGGKKRRNRRQSFAAPPDADLLSNGGDMASEERPSLVNVASKSHSRGSSTFYRLRGNNSNTSLESEALLDHRDQAPLPPRRQSTQPNIYAPRPSQPFLRNSPQRLTQNVFGRSKLSRQQEFSDSEDENEDANDRTPLISSQYHDAPSGSGGYGGTSAPSSSGKGDRRRGSNSSSMRRRPVFGQRQSQSNVNLEDYHVNNPPSVPASPVLGPDTGFNDVMLTDDLKRGDSPEPIRTSRSRDALIDIDEEPTPQQYTDSTPQSPKESNSEMRRRMTVMQAAEDVCFPLEGMSEIGAEDDHRHESHDLRRRRRRRWPDLGVLENWAHDEKEQRTIEGLRTRKVSEPLMIGGRLRPRKQAWKREEEEAPYRFTYFNEEFQSTVHSHTISELLQPGQTFRELFIPDPPVLEDSTDESSDDEMDPITRGSTVDRNHSTNGNSHLSTRNSSRLSGAKRDSSGEQTRASTPGRDTTPKPGQERQENQEKEKRYGQRPAFWLDILSPTEDEMRVIAKAFSIHPLTAEDIMLQEAREKVELFKHYYFINYRTFEQDENSEDYMEPVNIYVIVFREGVLSFHFSMTPHPANVRRRIRQLQDYLILSPDWISYAVIDDITDTYMPLIQNIEEEVDNIDDTILRLYSDEEEHETKKSKSASYNNPHYEKMAPEGETKEGGAESGRDMLRRIGECRKKVMSLYRLLGNKADVIKGFAKRCNQEWDVAPRSEIGLYLGDIQDHIVTMTANLSHYENLLSRAHSNYLAQINIRMNERQEKTSDILGKLTVLGTIVLPMNVVTGIWGMNCLVPGQDIENLNWFWCITSGLILFGLTSYFIAKRVYGIV